MVERAYNGIMKKIFSPKQKATVALEAIKGIKTFNQISSQYDTHPTQVGVWRKILLDNADKIFTDKQKQNEKEQEALIDRLYKLVGQRDTELEWLKKKLYIDT
jgi:transposase-like protein